jgi:hypothetical protein
VSCSTLSIDRRLRELALGNQSAHRHLTATVRLLEETGGVGDDQESPFEAVN